MPLPKIDQVKIKLPRVRGSFLDLFEPRALKNDPNSMPRFGASFLLDPKHPPHAQAKKEIEAEIERLKKACAPVKLVMEFCGPGEDFTNNQTGEMYTGYAGMWVVRANSPADKPPRVEGKDGDELEKGDSRVYSGVYCHGTVHLFVTDKGGKPRICCFLRAIRSLEYGEPLAGFSREREFEDFDEDDTDDFDTTGL